MSLYTSVHNESTPSFFRNELNERKLTSIHPYVTQEQFPDIKHCSPIAYRYKSEFLTQLMTERKLSNLNNQMLYNRTHNGFINGIRYPQYQQTHQNLNAQGYCDHARIKQNRFENLSLGQKNVLLSILLASNEFNVAAAAVAAKNIPIMPSNNIKQLGSMNIPNMYHPILKPTDNERRSYNEKAQNQFLNHVSPKHSVQRYSNLYVSHHNTNEAMPVMQVQNPYVRHERSSIKNILETQPQKSIFAVTKSKNCYSQQSSQQNDNSKLPVSKVEGQNIINVWSDNLEDAFSKIRDIVEHYHYVAIDTEFPGVVAIANKTGADHKYRTVKCNVDILNLIQLGITFADEEGRFPKEGSTWQFNFKFDLEYDLYAENSIILLRNHGIDFHTHQSRGIDILAFGELIISSGLVMSKDIKWISYHGCYDFGYLLKVLTCAPLPETKEQFFDLLHDYFPSFCDIKYLLKIYPDVAYKTSLEKAASHFNILRYGMKHQAGSDSLVTCQIFFKLKRLQSYEPHCNSSLFPDILYGLRRDHRFTT